MAGGGAEGGTSCVPWFGSCLDQRSPHPQLTHSFLHAGLLQFRAHCVDIILFCLLVVFLSL